MDYKKSDPFYHTAAWKAVRKLALERDGGYCQDCLERMRWETGYAPRRATMVHHIIPRKERPDLALQLDNLRSLCAQCHEERHPERRTKKKRKTLDRITPHGMRVVKV